MLRRFSRRQFLTASAASVGSAGLLAVTSADEHEPDNDTRHVRIEVEPGEIVTLEIVGLDAPVEEPPPDEPDDPEYPTQVVWHTPQEGTVVSGTITLWVEAPEETAGVWFHHGNWQWLGDDYDGPDYTFDVDTTQYADGGYVFTAQAVDANDQTLDTRTVNVVIDNSGDEPDEPEGQIIWQANHAGGNLNEWTANGGGGVFDSGGPTNRQRTQITSERSYNGGHSIRQILPASSSQHGRRIFRWREQRNENYFAWRTFIPEAYGAASWQGLAQFKRHDGSTSRSAWMVQTRLRNGRMYTTLASFLSGVNNESHHRDYRDQITVVDLPIGQWVSFQMHMIKSPIGTNQGRVRLWQDGALLYDTQNVATVGRMSDALHWAVVNYGAGLDREFTLYHDDGRLSETYMSGYGG